MDSVRQPLFLLFSFISLTSLLSVSSQPLNISYVSRRVICKNICWLFRWSEVRVTLQTWQQSGELKLKLEFKGAQVAEHHHLPTPPRHWSHTFVQLLGRNELHRNNLRFPQFGFLEQFGYLTGGGVASEALHTEEAVVEAIRSKLKSDPNLFSFSS